MNIEGRRTQHPGAEFDMKDGEDPLYVPDFLDGAKEIPEEIILTGNTYRYTGIVFGRARFELVR